MPLLGSTRRRRTQEGAAAVEFALVMPILLLLVFGAVQYGLYFWAGQGGSDAARTSARLAAVGSPVDCVAFRDAIEDQIDTFTANGSRVTITRTYYQRASPATPVPLAEDIEQGDYVQVEVTFRSVDIGFPFLPFVDDGLVNATAKTKVENIDEGQPEDCSYVEYIPT